MSNRKKYAGIVAALCCSILSFGQSAGPLGNFDHLPQTVYANPALMPFSRVNMGFPGLSGLTTAHGNNWFDRSEFVKIDQGGVAQLSAENLLESVDKFALTDAGTQLEILHLGFKFKDRHYFHVRAAERVQFSLKLPRDLFAFAVFGNVNNPEFDQGTANFSDLAVDAIHFREYALGYAFQWNSKWSFGATAKYLYGMESVQTTQSSLHLRTDPQTFDLSTSGSFQLNTSGVYGLANDSAAVQEDFKSYLLGLKNTGFGLDVGATFRPLEGLRLEFSAIDFGFIKWKEDIANYGTNDAGFAFNGVDLTEFIFQEGTEFEDSFQSELDSLLDDLENTYGFNRSSGQYTTWLNGYLRYAATYELYRQPKSSGSAWFSVSHGLGRSTAPFVANLGYNQTIGRWLQVGAHVSKRNHFSPTIGAGLALNAGPFQIYTLVENIAAGRMTKYVVVDDEGGESTEIIYFDKPSDIRFSFGINFTFGRKPKVQARSMIG